MRKRLAGHYNQADVDMTPMLDVVFILLIFFIVTATFLNERGLEMVKPPASEKESLQIPSILVTIDAENAVFVQSKTGLRRVEPVQLSANIEREIVEYGGRASVTIQPHLDSDHGAVTRAYDASVTTNAAGVAVRKPEAP